MLTRLFFLLSFIWLSTTSSDLFAQNSFYGLFDDLVIVEKESAAAKEVRLKWISEERNRIRDERNQFGTELEEIKEIVPDPVKERLVPPAVARAQQRAKNSFDDWANNNDPDRRNAVIRGAGLNALLKVLGPIAHYRRIRTNGREATEVLKSLSQTERIQAADVSHYKLNPSTSSGSKVVLRLNQLPLALEWPTVVLQNWQHECANITKSRDAYVGLLGAGGGGVKHVECAELLDNSLELLQAKVLQKKWSIPKNLSLTSNKKTQMHRELQEAIRYIETLRATADRFKRVPGDFKVHHFPGGTIEDFLDFCYTHGMFFQEAQPGDEEYYYAAYRHMQDYAHDVQFVEDWKENLTQRIQELDNQDQQLMWRASEQ